MTNIRSHRVSMSYSEIHGIGIDQDAGARAVRFQKKAHESAGSLSWQRLIKRQSGAAKAWSQAKEGYHTRNASLPPSLVKLFFTGHLVAKDSARRASDIASEQPRGAWTIKQVVSRTAACAALGVAAGLTGLSTYLGAAAWMGVQVLMTGGDFVVRLTADAIGCSLPDSTLFQNFDTSDPTVIRVRPGLFKACVATATGKAC